MKSPKINLNSLQRTLSGPEAHFYAFATFFAIVFFTGGGSRGDIQSLLILRPLAILFCAYALVVKTPSQWLSRKFPLYITAALLSLMILQLIPLPPSLWMELPGRQIFADIADFAGIEQPRRPLSLSPSRTINSLFSLAVPIAAMLLYLNLNREYRRQAIPVIIVLCVISAALAILQLMGSSRGPLYLYKITNSGYAVGLFANRNHQAIMLASGIAMLGWYAASLRPSAKHAMLKFYGSLAIILVFVPLIFVTGSRAGLILTLPALILAFSLIYFGDYRLQRSHRVNGSRNSKAKLPSGRRIILLISMIVTALIVGSAILLSRSSALDRLLGNNNLEGLRFQLLPTLWTMVQDGMPWGIGFGSFEYAFKVYESQDLLRPNYLNQAHNDWLQFLIEGGMPALLIALVAIFWLATRLLFLAKNWSDLSHSRYRGVMCVSVIGFLVAASIGDYPLRVPSLTAVFVVLVCIFNDSVRSVQHRDMR